MKRKYILKKEILKALSILELLIFFIISTCIEYLVNNIILLFIIILLFTYLFYILKKYNFI